MKKHSALMLAAVLAAACDGSNVTGDRPVVQPETDASVTMSDGGNPAPDAGQPDSQTTPPPVDAAVDPDVPSPPVDMPVTPTDTTTATQCWRQLCGRVRVITVDGMTYELTINCPPTGNEIGISPLNCVATCSGDGCTCNPEESNPPDMTAVVMNDRSTSGSACGDEFAISYTVAGMPMSPSNGTPVRLRRM